ncbi:MAG: 1-(5-phosphoribosyl)-5-((5-phosphoribosylamino)methylideneamino)imidazole-4-carboxamide isomerase, partial [Planctomycetes bacterium]|nr:1-(5-phosphoribosyl)-5-((5-phosphoribosylamino)methylideneamino)imidazole-4-carboxamide isomerase [Planctomycetota bacterium]
MEILPAIDLIDGKCVRLVQGEYHKKITYEDNPIRQAREFHEAGATWLHIVDLDGAKLGKPMNAEIVAEIAGHVPMKIELGGGGSEES